jgi:RNA polymerase sigma-70 factor (ECF subfamily)
VMSAWVEIAGNQGQPQQKRHQAFSRLVAEFQDMAFGSAYSLLGDYALAEDVAQDAFITAWQNLSQLRDAKAFPGWLRQIVTSQCHRRLRRKQLPTVPLENMVSLEAAIADDPEERFFRRTASETLHRVLNSLPEIERQVTILFYIADYTQAEIAVMVRPVRSRSCCARAIRSISINCWGVWPVCSRKR